MREEWLDHAKTRIVILWTVAGAPRAFANKHLTVAQFEQVLDKLKGKSDSKTAHELSGFESTERANSMRLNRWEREFPGRRAREAFTLLADASAFLDLPAEDTPNTPAPDNAAQQAIFENAVAYARDTITKLPNLYAARETTHFDDSVPRVPVDYGYVITPGRGKIAAEDGIAPGTAGDKSQDRPLHFVGRSSTVVTYRDEAELTRSQTGNKGNPENRATTLTTQGEFGPILTVVLSDATQSGLTLITGSSAIRSSMLFSTTRYSKSVLTTR
jgi:hypothetical protein